MECGVWFVEVPCETHQDASPGMGQGATHLDWLTGRAVVTSPLNPFWNKVEHQEFKEERSHILKSNILAPGIVAVSSCG